LASPLEHSTARQSHLAAPDPGRPRCTAAREGAGPDPSSMTRGRRTATASIARASPDDLCERRRRKEGVGEEAGRRRAREDPVSLGVGGRGEARETRGCFFGCAISRRPHVPTLKRYAQSRKIFKKYPKNQCRGTCHLKFLRSNLHLFYTYIMAQAFNSLLALSRLL
jgi:hypothetical protein